MVTSGSVGAVVSSGRVGSVVTSGSVGAVVSSGTVGSVVASGSVGSVVTSGSVGAVVSSGSVGSVVTSGSVGAVVSPVSGCPWEAVSSPAAKTGMAPWGTQENSIARHSTNASNLLFVFPFFIWFFSFLHPFTSEICRLFLKLCVTRHCTTPAIHDFLRFILYREL